MIVEKIEIATTIKPDEKFIEDFLTNFKKKYTNFKNDNVIIDFSDYKGVKTENILLFLKYSKEHKDNGMSFVMVDKGINRDDIPDEIIIVPTLTEAKDIIEMENIERDLGF